MDKHLHEIQYLNSQWSMCDERTPPPQASLTFKTIISDCHAHPQHEKKTAANNIPIQVCAVIISILCWPLLSGDSIFAYFSN